MRFVRLGFRPIFRTFTATGLDKMTNWMANKSVLIVVFNVRVGEAQKIGESMAYALFENWLGSWLSTILSLVVWISVEIVTNPIQHHVLLPQSTRTCSRCSTPRTFKHRTDTLILICSSISFLSRNPLNVAFWLHSLPIIPNSTAHSQHTHSGSSLSWRPAPPHVDRPALPLCFDRPPALWVACEGRRKRERWRARVGGVDESKV